MLREIKTVALSNASHVLVNKPIQQWQLGPQSNLIHVKALVHAAMNVASVTDVGEAV